MLLLIALLLACEDPAPGAIHLRAPGVVGDLVIDGITHGPVQDEQTIELAAGGHRVAIWRGGRELIAETIEVRSRMAAELAIDPSTIPGEVAAPPPPPPLPAVPAVPEPIPEPVLLPEPVTASPHDVLLPVLLQQSGALRRACGDDVRDPVRIDLRIHVRADGTVDRATTQGGAGRLGRCVEREARTWRFPPIADDAEIAMPISFTPG